MKEHPSAGEYNFCFDCKHQTQNKPDHLPRSTQLYYCDLDVMTTTELPMFSGADPVTSTFHQMPRLKEVRDGVYCEDYSPKV